MIKGSELKTIETLATGNGCLRSLMTAAHGVAQFSGNADITKAVETLLDIRVEIFLFPSLGHAQPLKEALYSGYKTPHRMI